ncbi:hypothetical protein NFI96_003794 [Prochilodus magdalenae]|nr:hypothetical protein NFI96_003794 [Prochilodus magdalenae]
MLGSKRMADMGYRLFSGSMMLLTLYAGYLCTMRGYRYMERQKQLQLQAQDQTVDPEWMGKGMRQRDEGSGRPTRTTERENWGTVRQVQSNPTATTEGIQ